MEEKDGLATEIFRELKAQCKRYFIMVLVLIFVVVGSNALWLYYWNLPTEAERTVEVSQDNSDGGNNNFIGNDGDVTDGSCRDCGN